MTLLLACDWLLETRMLSWQEECKKMPAGYVNLEFSNLKSFQEDLTSLRKIAQFVPVSFFSKFTYIITFDRGSIILLEKLCYHIGPPMLGVMSYKPGLHILLSYFYTERSEDYV